MQGRKQSALTCQRFYVGFVTCGCILYSLISLDWDFDPRSLSSAVFASHR
jgi:hypothetical protein